MGRQANDRQMVLARQIVEAIWRKRVMAVAEYTLRDTYRGRERSVVILTPGVGEYDEAERVIVEHDGRYSPVAQEFDATFAEVSGDGLAVVGGGQPVDQATAQEDGPACATASGPPVKETAPMDRFSMSFTGGYAMSGPNEFGFKRSETIEVTGLELAEARKLEDTYKQGDAAASAAFGALLDSKRGESK